jgi:hypothetical protein
MKQQFLFPYGRKISGATHYFCWLQGFQDVCDNDDFLKQSTRKNNNYFWDRRIVYSALLRREPRVQRYFMLRVRLVFPKDLIVNLMLQADNRRTAAKTPAKRSAYQILSVTVVFVILVFKL